MDVEVVHPEPGHLFVQLVRRIEVAQQRAGGRLAPDRCDRLLIGLLRGLLLVRVGQLVGRLVLGLQVDDQLGHRRAGDGHGVDLRLGHSRQAVARGGLQLPVQPGARADRGHLRRRRRRLAPGQPVEQRQVVGAGRRIGQGGAGERGQAGGD